MQSGRLAWGVLAVFLAAVALTGCGDDSGTGPGTENPVMADFSLLDVNPNSATTGSNLSPRQYLGQVSAWYFGAAT